MMNARTSRSDRGSARRAFSLAEALLATTILAIVAASATLPFSAGAQNALEGQKLEQGVELAEALMEEILARPFFADGQTSPTPGPEAGEDSRLKYNSIDDYDGFSESDKVLRNYKADPVNESATNDFWRQSAVSFVTYPGMQTGDTNSFALVTVNVYYKTSLLVTLKRVVSRED